MNAFVVGRNRAWIPGIKKLLQQGGACIAVGAGHLVGDNSIQRILKAEGIETARVWSR